MLLGKTVIRESSTTEREGTALPWALHGVRVLSCCTMRPPFGKYGEVLERADGNRTQYSFRWMATPLAPGPSTHRLGAGGWVAGAPSVPDGGPVRCSEVGGPETRTGPDLPAGGGPKQGPGLDLPASGGPKNRTGPGPPCERRSGKPDRTWTSHFAGKNRTGPDRPPLL